MAGHIVIGDRAPDQNYRQLGSPRSKLASNLVALLIRSHCFVDDLAQQPVIRHLRMKGDVPWFGTGAGFDEGGSYGVGFPLAASKRLQLL